MARGQVELEADVSAALKGIQKLSTQIDRIETDTKGAGRQMEKFGQHIKTAGIHLATSYITFKAIAGVQDMIATRAQEFKESLAKSLEIAKEFAQAKAPQFMFPGAAGRDTKEWELAQITGLDPSETATARTALKAMGLSPQQVKAALRASLALRTLAPQAGAEQIATGLGEVLRERPGLGAAGATGVGMYIQRHAKGQFQDILNLQMRAISMGLDLGMGLPQSMGIAASMTQGAWEPEKATMAFRRFMLQAIKEPTGESKAAWRQLGMQDLPMYERFEAMAGGLQKGELTPAQLVKMFGQRQYAPIFKTLRNWPQVQERIGLAEELLQAPGVPIRESLQAQLAPGSLQARQLSLRRAKQREAYETFQMERAATTGELAGVDYRSGLRRIGGGVQGLGWGGFWYERMMRGASELISPGMPRAEAPVIGETWEAWKEQWIGPVRERPGRAFVPGQVYEGVESIIGLLESEDRVATPGQRPVNINMVEEDE